MLGPEGTPRQGCMKTRRFIDMTFLAAALAFAAVLPASASAGSLLSGYGGPGQGNQAILGAALVNGPTGRGGHGSGGSGGSGAGAQGGGASSLAVAAVPAAGAGGTIVVAGSAAAHGSHALARGGRGSSAGHPRAGTTAAGSQRQPVASAAAVSETSVAGGPALGLSDADLLYILLALGVLLLTGVLTRKMAQRPEVETQAR